MCHQFSTLSFLIFFKRCLDSVDTHNLSLSSSFVPIPMKKKYDVKCNNCLRHHQYITQKSRTLTFEPRHRIDDTSARRDADGGRRYPADSSSSAFYRACQQQQLNNNRSETDERHHVVVVVDSLRRFRSSRRSTADIIRCCRCSGGGGSGSFQLRSHGPLCRIVVGEFQQPYEQQLRLDDDDATTDVEPPPPSPPATTTSPPSSPV